jgi:hypothetical protein
VELHHAKALGQDPKTLRIEEDLELTVEILVHLPKGVQED